MINKKRVFIFGAFLLCLFFLMTFAGGRNEEVAMKTVEFIDGFNNETISLQEVEVGEDAEVPEEPAHENYVFAGWYLYDDQDVRVTDFTEILEDLTVIGKYADDKNNNGIADDVDDYYNVVFVDSVDNTIISTQTVLEGLDATAPFAPIHNGFTFAGWSRGYTNVRENITVNALYILNEEAAGNEVVLYEVTFIDGETDEVIEVQEVQEGLAATLPEPPLHENRVFDHWEGEYEEIVENTEITAIYVDDLNNDGIADEEQVRVIFEDYDGEELYNNLVTIGEATPEVEAPTREYYEFESWTPELSETVTEEVTYRATYTPINDVNGDGIADEEQFTVTYNDYNNELIRLFTYVTKGDATPTIANPTRENYEFTGWTPELSETVTGNAIYTATYAPINDANGDGIADEEQFTVTYNDYNNELIKSFTYVTKGEETPVIANPTRENYEFESWTPELSETVTGNATYTATYTPINDVNGDGIADEEQFTVTYNDYNNELIRLFTYVTKGDATPTIANPERANYEFTGWTPEVAEFVTETVTYTATYAPINDANGDGIADEEQFTVTYNDYNDTLIKSFTYVTKGDATPTVENPTREYYKFAGWDKEITEFVTKNATYTATYIPINDVNGDGVADEEQFTITYNDYDNTLIKSFAYVTKGETTPTIENPTREYYEFAGWDKEVAAIVTEDVTYTATYTPINDTNNDGVADEEQARVIFKGEDGVELYNNLVTIGQATPTVESPIKEGYSFAGWNNVETNVVGIEPTVTTDVTFIATYIDNIAPTIAAHTILYNEEQNATIYATVTDISGIKTVKVLKGTHEVSAFDGNGTELTLENGAYALNGISENGVYTLYALDTNGNASVQTVEVEGIIILEGEFEDLYASGSFGNLDGFIYYERELNIATKGNVKIVDARVQINKWYNGSGLNYATIDQFEADANFGTPIKYSEDGKTLNYEVSGWEFAAVSVYVKYEYKIEVAPGVFETRYVSKLYKTRLSMLAS